MRKPTIQLLIEQMNQYCADGKWFWVCGLARETWPVLIHVLDQLHEVAQDAVQHYAEEATNSLGRATTT